MTLDIEPPWFDSDYLVVAVLEIHTNKEAIFSSNFEVILHISYFDASASTGGIPGFELAQSSWIELF